MISAKPPNEDIEEVYPRLFQSGFHVPKNNPELMQKLGITHILNVSNCAPNAYPDLFEYCKIANIQDTRDQQITDYLPEGLKFITEALAANAENKVLVHCAAGISRSGAFCAAYML